MTQSLFFICVSFCSALCASSGWYHSRRTSIAVGWAERAQTYGIMGALLSAATCFALLVFASLFQSNWIEVVVWLVLAQLCAFVVPVGIFIELGWRICNDAFYDWMRKKVSRYSGNHRNRE